MVGRKVGDMPGLIKHFDLVLSDRERWTYNFYLTSYYLDVGDAASPSYVLIDLKEREGLHKLRTQHLLIISCPNFTSLHRVEGIFGKNLSELLNYVKMYKQFLKVIFT